MPNRESQPSNVVPFPLLLWVCGGIQVPYKVGRTSPGAASKIVSIELARIRSLTKSTKPPAA